MISQQQAEHFAAKWADAWNSHDLEHILSHYTEEFSIETPMAAKLVPESMGLISGKDAVRKYWTIGLQNNPQLHFEVHEVLLGVNGLTIYYTNTSTGRRVAEVIWLNEQLLAYKCAVFYSA